MKQVSQNLRNGKINIEEAPVPGLKSNQFILKPTCILFNLR